jgi:murein DD-endopeptidase MepM/ murein hydrolase activator NlpD
MALAHRGSTSGRRTPVRGRESTKIFRERQIIVHDGIRAVRFTLRRWHQIAVCTLIAGFLAWGSVASVAFFAGQQIVAARSGEISRRVAELDGIKASYRAAFERLDQFQSLFSDITCEIGDIQSSLLHVAERNLAPDRRGPIPRQSAAIAGRIGCTNEPPADDRGAPAMADGEMPAVDPSASEDSPRFVGQLRNEEQEAVRLRVNQLSAALERLRETHGAFLRQSADIAAKRVGDLEKALSRVGVDASQLGDADHVAPPSLGPNGYGSGGPFVPMPKSAASAALSATPSFDPVTLFNSRADRLDSLILAIHALPLAAPLEDYELTSPFGSRDDPFNEQSAFHEGVDLGAPVGSAVLATGDGTVTWAGWRDKYGNLVEIDHGHGLTTRYAHLARTLVRVGDRVLRGRPVGLLGNTGRSTGPHLHYEVRVNDVATDPLKFITAGRDVLKTQ